MESVIIIPARLKASRLAEKLLLPLDGKPILQWTYEACLRSEEAEEVWIAVDHPRLLEACQKFTDKVKLTDASHQSGTDRVAEVAAILDADFVINVQGDEPFIDPKLIDLLFRKLRSEEVEMASAFVVNENLKEMERPETVKVVCNKKGEALFFSRALIPLDRDPAKSGPRKQHIGIYGYTKKALQRFVSWPPSELELREKLEQLRALENGMAIHMLEAEEIQPGIDTESDYQEALRIVNSRKS